MRTRSRSAAILLPPVFLSLVLFTGCQEKKEAVKEDPTVPVKVKGCGTFPVRAFVSVLPG